MKSKVAVALTASSRGVRGASGASLNTRPALTITACWLSLDLERTSLMTASDCAANLDPLTVWSAANAAALASAEALARELRAATTPDLAMIVVASRQLRHALG